MTRGEIFTARVERIAAGGAGIARLNGKSIFIELTAPGDLVCFHIRNDHKNWAEGELVEITEPSSLRTVPVCHLYGRCGGCCLQHLCYEAQIEAKTEILRNAFTRIGKFTPPRITARGSVPFEYRNRVHFHCLYSDENLSKPSLGFKERKSSRLVVLEDCPVADGGIRKALKAGTINAPPGRKRFTVYSRLNTFLSEGGTEQGRVTILDRELAIDAGVFFQSNAAALELLIRDIIALASNADRNLPMADIYCGVGTFSSFLCGNYNVNDNYPGFSEIDLVEENKDALALARENVRGKKVNFHALTDNAWVKSQGNDSASRHWGFMVLDPPREGLSGPLREFLARAGPDLMAYVSCDPATLARDSRSLLEGGYELKELTLYDFYPQTAHIESLAVFGRSKNNE